MLFPGLAGHAPNVCRAHSACLSLSISSFHSCCHTHFYMKTSNIPGCLQGCAIFSLQSDGTSLIWWNLVFSKMSPFQCENPSLRVDVPCSCKTCHLLRFKKALELRGFHIGDMWLRMCCENTALVLLTLSSRCPLSCASSVFPCTKAALSRSPPLSHFPRICPLVVHAPLSPLRRWQWDTWATAMHPWGQLVSPVIVHTRTMNYGVFFMIFFSWVNEISLSPGSAVITPCVILADISQAQCLREQYSNYWS